MCVTFASALAVWLNTRNAYVTCVTSFLHIIVLICTVFILVINNTTLPPQDSLAAIDGILSLMLVIDRTNWNKPITVFLGMISTERRGGLVYTSILTVITTLWWCFVFNELRPTSLFPENPIIAIFMMMRLIIPMSQVYITLFLEGVYKEGEIEVYRGMQEEMASHMSIDMTFSEKMELYIYLLITNSLILIPGNNMIVMLRELI